MIHGKTFMAQAFGNNTGYMHVQTKPVPIEALHSMTMAERYQASLRKAFGAPGAAVAQSQW